MNKNERFAKTFGVTVEYYRTLSFQNRQRVLNREPLVLQEAKKSCPVHTEESCANREAENERRRAEYQARVAAREKLDANAGPGTELKKMTAQIGAKYCSSCEGTANWMDQLGIEGCRREREAIVARINTNRKKLPWVEQIEIAALAATHLFDWHLNPLDPIGSMVDESIRRAEHSNQHEGQRDGEKKEMD